VAEGAHNPPQNTKLKVILFIAVLLLFFAVAEGADAPDSGRYDGSPPGNLELESKVTDSSLSCGDDTNAACHLRNFTFGRDEGSADGADDSTIGNDTIDMSPYGGRNDVRHPNANRGPAGLFYDWVHQHHGGTNWPMWQQPAPENTAGAEYLISGRIIPYNPTRETGGDGSGGKGDADIVSVQGLGTSSGTDQHIGRNYAEIGDTRSAHGYWWETDAAAPPLYYLGNPGATGGPRHDLIGCAYGTQDATAELYSEGQKGCHATAPQGGGATAYDRTDTPLCTKCHIGVTSNSTNAKHDQRQCYNCHQSGSSTSTSNQLGADAADAQAFTPIKRECFSESTCHNSTVITGWSNNTFAHAGRDCRYCHGHGHNITVSDKSGSPSSFWNRSCGNTDSICHSASAPAPRNIGGDSTFRHGGTTNNVTCGDCHIPSGSIAHNITVPSCRKCHNSTGIGNASTGSSSIYGDSGDTRSNTTPNWDRGNNIYHDGGGGFGTLGGMNCSYCHTPGITDTTKVHYINTTQNTTTNSNIVPQCRDTRCHGSGGAGTYIQFSHGEAIVTASSPYGRDLTCVMCHNNYSIWIINSTQNYSRTINTYLHTSAGSGYNITPYNSTRDAQGNVSNQVCLNCHQGTTGVAGNCASSACHGNATGALLVHDDDMNQAGSNLDGVMSTGGPDCSDSGCHDIDDPGGSMGQINFTALNRSVHAKLNENATMTISPVKGAVVKACWGCHNWKADGAEPPSGSMSSDDSNHKEPATCFMCHNGTTLFTNVSNAPKVFEHFGNGSDIKAANSSATIVLSCLSCHNKTEMIQENNDPDTNKSNWPDQDGDGIIGGNRSFYHYGKNRSSELRVSRSSYADCGENSESTTNCSNWNKFPASPTYTFTNCSYCHQNTSTAFESAMENSFHKNVLNHSDNSNNPYCTDCHIINDGNTTYRLHDNALTKPYNASSETVAGRVGGMYNSSLCTTCHRGQKEVHAENDPGNNTLECASCHANASNWTNEKQIHGIRYINDSGVYSQEWERAAAANCTTCHQRDFITYVNGTLSGYIAGVNNGTLIPKIPFPLNHSNNLSAGTLWNKTSAGYFGPWKNPDSNNLRGCLYCHGNIDKDQITCAVVCIATAT
jgi:hypothetical protein